MIRTILRFLRLCGLLILDSVVMLGYPRTNTQSNKSRVLLIRLDAIGDFILWFDSAKELRRLYPQSQYELILLGNVAWTSLAEDISCFDRTWSLNITKFINNPVYRFKMLKKIRQAGFGIIIQPTFSRVFLTGDTIVRVSGAEKKIGSQGDCCNIKPWQKRISDRWYTRIIPADSKPLMELRRNAEFMRGLGLKEFRANMPELAVSIPLASDMNITDYYVLFPGAGSERRQWPVSCFVELARKIYHATGWMGVICGGRGEEILGKMLAEETGGIPIQDWTGRTSLKELAAVIDRAHVVIGNETSAVHIAAAVSTPAVCILGGGHYGQFMPYELEDKTARPLPVAVVHKMDCFGCNWQCIYKEPHGEAVPCVTNIPVDAVWSAVCKILEKRNFWGKIPVLDKYAH